MSRSAHRNVNFYNGSTGVHLGGVRQSGSITNANFFDMLTDVLLDVEATISIHFKGTGVPIPINNNRLAEGDYDIFCPQGDIKLTRDTCVLRIHSRSRSAREDSFRDSVRARDGKCVFTGVVNQFASSDEWTGFEAAHIFPMGQQELWSLGGFSRFITRPGRHPVNSVQNGLLLAAHMHQLFDSFLLSVNPDDGYKIIDFSGNNWNVDGRILDIVCRDPNNLDHVADELLRWHFQQCVLANMKGAGEPIFEHDFPSGTDMMNEIIRGPLPAQRMELELFSRLQQILQEDDEFVS
ncbi:hypothetical protein N7516_004658 [Penicillium verrucosum]|uniref:uncharacterized protein n=1 Tax=Penicillium verrucosum TaxID=60171 RepID=UPI0025451ED5|nr:uncharacterized protein N7516_004658 [Penicillium verrucosum]KAJ5944490.1 hypothetical protein N7516_004658 [Penicillium verrucosum]